MLDFVTTSSYVDPTGFPHGGKYFLFPQNKPQMSAGRWWNLKRRVLHLAGTKNSNRTDRICFWRNEKIFAEIEFWQKRINHSVAHLILCLKATWHITQISFFDSIVLVGEHWLLAKTFRPFRSPAKCKTRRFRFISLKWWRRQKSGGHKCTVGFAQNKDTVRF